MLLSIRNKDHFEYFCIHIFHDLHDYGKERILTNDRGHSNSLTLHAMEGGGAHAGQPKLQSSISLASGQNSEYISESSIMLGTKSNLSNLYHKKCTATLSTHEATQHCREALNVDVTQVYSNVSNPE